MDQIAKAYGLLKDWKGDEYIHGNGVVDDIGGVVAKYGKKALVIGNASSTKPFMNRIVASLVEHDIALAGGKLVPGAKPNAPREDVYRLVSYILQYRPDCIVAVGGGSTIDACKAADALAVLGKGTTPEIDPYFGTGTVTAALKEMDANLLPLIAVETSASSGSHLTKYANITDTAHGQKKLIVDDALVPTVALFDYETTMSMPLSVTIDGAFDAIAHTFEVFCGAKPDKYEKTKAIAECAIDLVTTYTKVLVDDPKDDKAREAIGLATDLGGYAIMIGGTSGAHLTSFSLVDIVSHGTACGIMNPYYAVFYSKAIQKQLAVVAKVLASNGFAKPSIALLEGRPLAEAVARAMIDFGRSIHAPTKLQDLKGFGEMHIQRALAAAKDPQLAMKLKNMPVPMTASDVDGYMEPILRAAATGDLSLIKELP